MSTFWLQIYYVVATIFLKYYFLTCTTCSCPFTDGIELQLIQEIWGVPMLLSPVSAKSFMKVTLSYCTTYWWRYNVTEFPLMLIFLKNSLLLICLLFFSSTTVITKKKSQLILQGYIKSNFPLGALTVKDEILRQGLKPDRLTYNTIISACVKSSEIDKAIQFLKDMKVPHKCWKGQF